MSTQPKQHKQHTCDQLGVCQHRWPPCANCTPPYHPPQWPFPRPLQAQRGFIFAPGVIEGGHTPAPRWRRVLRVLWRGAGHVYQAAAFAGFVLLVALLLQAADILKLAESKQAAICQRADAAVTQERP